MTPKLIIKGNENHSMFHNYSSKFNLCFIESTRPSLASSAASATDSYVSALEGASEKVSKLSETYERASESLVGLTSTTEEGASFGEQMQKVSKNLAALNNVYELQLKGSSQHLESSEKFQSQVTEMMSNLSDSVEDTKLYKENMAMLSKNLTDLNSVYGNMLKAMTISRDYPFNDIYTHVLGYVSQPDKDDILSNKMIQEKFVPGIKIGKLGLEKTLENDLIGVNDIQRYEVNAYGKRINHLEYQKGKPGSKIRITLDTEVQKLSAELLTGKAGSISVMDIYTGEVIAMYSSPSYNPNLFLFGISQEEWQLIRNNPLKPLINKTLSGLYSPGSTIKPIVALSALENDIIDPNFKVQCKGKMELYGQTFHCWKEKGHGFMRLKNAMKQSCDTYFYEVARKLGVDRLKITADKFGLGKKVS